MRMKAFKFGVEFSPWWFLQKVEHKFIEYINEKGKVVGCRFYDTKGNEVTKMVGDYITMDMLYKEEPVKEGGNEYV